MSLCCCLKHQKQTTITAKGSTLHKRLHCFYGKKENSAKATEKDHLNDQNGIGHFQKNERIESLGQHISEHCIFAGDVFRIHGQQKP